MKYQVWWEKILYINKTTTTTFRHLLIFLTENDSNDSHESCASVKATNENTRKHKIWLFNVVTHSIFWTLIRTMVNVFHHMPRSPIFFVCRKRDVIMNHRGMFSFPALINNIRTVVHVSRFKAVISLAWTNKMLRGYSLSYTWFVINSRMK